MKKFENIVKNLLSFSLALKAGDKLIVDASGKETKRFAFYVKKFAAEQGIDAQVWFKTKKQTVTLWNNISEEELSQKIKNDLAELKKSKGYLRVSAFSIDKAGLSEKGHHNFRGVYFKKVHTEYRVNKMQWCVLGFPSREFAKEAHMSKKQYEQFVIKNTGLNYSKMAKALEPLKKLMEKTDKVQITAKDTNITFSIKNQPAIICAGHKNLPDGEIYCGPVRNSINGTIAYNTKSFEGGHEFSNVVFTIKNGKIVKATAQSDEKTNAINKILDIDKNARYFGEFAIGVNPFITKPVGNTLFDEKITGSIHFTPGCCYEDSDNGNISALHWDLVLMLTEEFGGGEIKFDGKLIQKNGVFVEKTLEKLNKQHLV